MFFKKFCYGGFLLLLMVILEHTCMATMEMIQERKKLILRNGCCPVFRPYPNSFQVPKVVFH